MIHEARGCVRAGERSPGPLYAGVGEDQHAARFRAVRRREDEQSSAPAVSPLAPAAAGRNRRVEHEYERGGALAYLAAWDVR